MLFTSDYMEETLHQLSRAIHSAIAGTEFQRECIPHVLHDLIGLETRPACLTEIAFDWCSVIYENRESLGDWKGLLFASLEIGFRHLDPQDSSIRSGYSLTCAKPYQEIEDVAFGSQKSEAIADLLQAYNRGALQYTSRGTLAERLVCLHNLVPFSPRLRQLVIRSVELLGYRQFEEVGVEKFIGLLNHLHVTVEDMDSWAEWSNFRAEWLDLLLVTFQTSEGALRLSHWYWELLVELTISWPPGLYRRVTYNSQITTFLAEAKEWSKLECWMGTVWVLWPPGANEKTEEDLGHSIPLLFRKRPGAFEKLKQWMEQWSRINHREIPESFQRICEQAYKAAQRDTP